jgi:hypothetical protein
MAKAKVRVVEQEVERTSFVRKVKQVEKRCPVCHTLFWGATISRYCSRACQQKANYDRHAETYRKERMKRYRAEKKVTGKK